MPELQPQSTWQQLTIGFPKRRHVYVYRLPLATALLTTSTIVLLTCGLIEGVTVGGALATSLNVLLAVYFGRLHKRTEKCWSVEQAAERLGKLPHELYRIIAEKDLVPRFVVDGNPVYDPSDLTDAGILLRAVGPAEDELLLRAAGSVIGENQTLMRPATDEIENRHTYAIPEVAATNPQPFTVEKRT